MDVIEFQNKLSQREFCSTNNFKKCTTIDNTATVCECVIIVNITLRVDQSMYFVSEMRGTMFIDCSSWKSSLHAYGIFREEMSPDDRQKWHLHIARERIRLSCIISSIKSS